MNQEDTPAEQSAWQDFATGTHDSRSGHKQAILATGALVAIAVIAIGVDRLVLSTSATNATKLRTPSGTMLRPLHGTMHFYWNYQQDKDIAALTGQTPKPPGCGPASIPTLSMIIKSASGRVLRVVNGGNIRRGKTTPTGYTDCYAAYTVAVPQSNVYILADDFDPQDTITVNATDVKDGALPAFEFGN